MKSTTYARVICKRKLVGDRDRKQRIAVMSTRCRDDPRPTLVHNAAWQDLYLQCKLTAANGRYMKVNLIDSFGQVAAAHAGHQRAPGGYPTALEACQRQDMDQPCHNKAYTNQPFIDRRAHSHFFRVIKYSSGPNEPATRVAAIHGQTFLPVFFASRHIQAMTNDRAMTKSANICIDP